MGALGRCSRTCHDVQEAISGIITRVRPDTQALRATCWKCEWVYLTRKPQAVLFKWLHENPPLQEIISRQINVLTYIRNFHKTAPHLYAGQSVWRLSVISHSLRDARHALCTGLLTVVGLRLQFRGAALADDLEARGVRLAGLLPQVARSAGHGGQALG